MIPYIDAVEKYSAVQLVFIDNILTNLSREELRLLFFLRVWCCYEVYYAVIAGVNIVVKCGRHTSELISLGNTGDKTKKVHSFETKKKMMENVLFFVDINRAMAMNPADKEMILHKFKNHAGGVENLNSKIIGAIIAARNARDIPIVQSAACGDNEALSQIILANDEKYIVSIAGGVIYP